MKKLVAASIVLIALLAFLLIFLLVPVIPFHCQNNLSTTAKGSVSLSCNVLGFGEVHQNVSGYIGNLWSYNCNTGDSYFCSYLSLGYLP